MPIEEQKEAGTKPSSELKKPVKFLLNVKFHWLYFFLSKKGHFLIKLSYQTKFKQKEVSLCLKIIT